MLGRKARDFRPLTAVTLEDLVPEDNFYRQVNASIDLSFPLNRLTTRLLIQAIACAGFLFVMRVGSHVTGSAIRSSTPGRGWGGWRPISEIRLPAPRARRVGPWPVPSGMDGRTQPGSFHSSPADHFKS